MAKKNKEEKGKGVCPPRFADLAALTFASERAASMLVERCRRITSRHFINLREKSDLHQA